MVRMINCEYSTLFYNGWPILNDLIERYRPDLVNTALTKYGKTVFNAGFLVTFVKFRVWDIGAKSLLNPESYSWHATIFENNWIPYVYHNVNLLAFYLLNLYWFLIIIKKTVKPLLQNFNSYLWCEYLTQYSAGLSFVFPFVVYCRSGAFDIPAIIHCHGLLFLVGGGYLYHRALYLKIKREGESIDCLDCDKQLKLDVFGVNHHLFGTIFARCWYYFYTSPFSFATPDGVALENFPSPTPFGSPGIARFVGFLHVMFMGVCCVASGYFTPLYIDKMKSDGIQLICDKEIINRYYLHALINFPCFLGSMAVISMTAIVEQSYPDSMANLFLYLCIYWTKILIIKLEPFYKLSHVGMHVVLACHHAILAAEIVRMRSGVA
jgi:hypothetical protein